MAAIEVVLLRLGTAVANTAARLWLRNRAAEEERRMPLIQLAGARGLGIIPQRRLDRQFQQLAETIATRIQPLATIEFSGIEPNEREAAVAAASGTLEETDLSDRELLSANLSSIEIERRLLQVAPTVLARAPLSEPAYGLFRRVLSEAAAYLAEVISVLPSFRSRAIRELLERDSLIIDQLREILDRMPQRVSEGDSADTDNEFELEYRREVARKLDHVELFGVTVAGSSRRYPLSIGYITLSASGLVKRRAVGQEEGQIAGTTEGVEDSTVDDVLANADRTLIRGEAGSGKTTLLRWIAVKCAQRAFEGRLADWNRKIPFFIQLRRFADQELPRPSQFIDPVAWQLSDNMPKGWAYRTLQSGKAIMLIDGVDELPEARRNAVREWLTDLVAAFPKTTYVVTSRPPAVKATWLASELFFTTELQPMNRTQVRSFIRHWHLAARIDSSDADADSFLEYERALLAAIDTSRSLRTLATNPLLCALICALHRDRHTQLPRGRMELYRTALEMLIWRRDDERRVSGGAGLSLSYEDRLLLLEDLAFWFTLNGFTTADSMRVKERLAACLHTMPGTALDAAAAYDFLLLRTGLLREQSADQVDFVHKTFQEYLASKRIVDTDSVEMLLRHLEDDSYREVVVMAAGLARYRECQTLIQGILAKVEKPRISKPRRLRLKLLAISCLETIRELAPELHGRVLKCLSEVVPPKSIAEARLLAPLGDEVLDLLRSPDASTLTDGEAAATVHTAALIGGRAALDIVAGYGTDHRTPVIRELVRAWSYSTEPESFAQDVLGKSPLLDGKLRLTDPSLLVGVRHLTRLRELTCEFSDVADLTPLEHLRGFPALRQLRLRNTAGLENLELLADHPGLELLHLYGCKGLGSIRQIVSLHLLSSLAIGDCPKVGDLGPILGVPSLTVLELETVDRSFVQQTLRTLGGLRRLALRRCRGMSSLDEFLAPSELNKLWLDAFQDLRSLRGADRLPELREIAVIDCPLFSDLAVFPGQARIRSLILKWCPDLVEFEQLERFGNLRSLDLQGSVIDDLSPLLRLPQLQVLNLAECERIRDLSPLGALPNLRQVNIAQAGYASALDVSVLSGNPDLTIVHSNNVTNVEAVGPRSRTVAGTLAE